MADSKFRLLATEVNTRLAAILTAEGRKIPEFSWGMRRPFTGHEAPVRIVWAHAGGRFVFETKALEEGEETPITPPLGTRVAVAEIRIWFTSEEEAEHVLDRLWMATREVPSSRVFRWAEARYEFPSELIGEDLKNGVSVIRLMLPCDMPVAGQPDIPGSEVIVAGSAFRVGIENPAGEDAEDSEYDVIRPPDFWT